MNDRWLGACALVLLGAACRGAGTPVEQEIADAVMVVLSADREVYTREVVHRLQNEEAVIEAGERWKDDRLLPLPAQMLRMGAERAQDRTARFTYALLSAWPINKQNLPRTQAERAGLAAVARSGDPYRAEETIEGTTYFTAVYPDRAVSEACVSCHNAHRDSPRKDFALGDVMGGVVVRVRKRRVSGTRDRSRSSRRRGRRCR